MDRSLHSGDGATRVLAWHLSWKSYPDPSKGEKGFRPKDWHVVHTLKQPAMMTCPTNATARGVEYARASQGGGDAGAGVGAGGGGGVSGGGGGIGGGDM